ncbi:hypothetical protein P22_2175 [Propionispora sp. 2/2-37]|uniref:flagellar export protein FliJ n=1 Tax=Propionispora sp. 2/2-37 TaxID=1677858 RepID=UPI0006BB6354|nr:flagellar export protein FliJ [Propionispora sp. 2/2-37]CUH96087.1 hypothetical protein P22_2175 [Propionispora sp. 2/2-37]
MKRFHFRLETLLKYRQMQKEEAQVRFSQALDEVRRAREALAKLEAEVAFQLDEFRGYQMRKKLTVDILMMFNSYFSRMKEETSAAEQQVETAEKKRQELMKALEEAVKNHKVVKNLRNKRVQEYRAEVLREEQKQLDEIGTQIFVHGSR